MLSHQVRTKPARVLITCGVATCAVVLGHARAANSPSAAQHALSAHQQVQSSAISQGARIQNNVALVVDVSSEMKGQALSSLKTAAEAFVATLLDPPEAQNTTRLALVPFAQGVKVPSEVFERVIHPGPKTRLQQTKSWHWYHGWHTNTETVQKTSCVAERFGRHAFSDVAPTNRDRFTAVYAQSDICAAGTQNTLMPLSRDREQIVSGIASLTTSGAKATQVGLAWGWYALSRNWTTVWNDNTTANADAPWTKPARDHKVVVLVSGGERPVQFSSDGAVARVKKAANGHARRQVRRLCQNMKAAKLTIYSVVLNGKENSPLMRTLASCASTPARAIHVEEPEKLAAALEKIARDIRAVDQPSS